VATAPALNEAEMASRMAERREVTTEVTTPPPGDGETETRGGADDGEEDDGEDDE